MSEFDGSHTHLSIESRLFELERDESPPLFGVTTYPPRNGRSQLEEFAHLQQVLGQPIHLRYTFSSTMPTAYDKTPMRNDDPWQSLWSFKADPVSIASGTLDTRWLDFIATVPIDGKIRRIVYYQEPADNMSSTVYRDAFTRLRGLLYNSGRQDVMLGMNLSSWDFDPANSKADGIQYIEPNADFIGISLFANNVNPNVNRKALYTAIRCVADIGVPFALSSVGVSKQQTPAQVDSWLLYLGSLILTGRLSGVALDHVICYSSNVAPADWTINDWYMDGSPDTLASWQRFYDLAIKA